MSRSHMKKPKRTPRQKTRTPDQYASVARALRSGHPLPLLVEAAGALQATRPMGGAEPVVSYEQLLASLADIVIAPTTAVITALELLSVGEERTMTAPILATRTHRLPHWMSTIDEVEITGVTRLTNIRNDDDNYAVGIRWPGGQEATCVVDIDHNAGTVLNEAFMMGRPVDEVTAEFIRYADEEGMVGLKVDASDPADARARIEAAIADGDRFLEPIATESWPACRPLVEWVLRQLPEGGTGYDDTEVSEERIEELVDAFFASAPGTELGRDAATTDITTALIDIAGGHPPYDPLRWSPKSVEITMLERFPRRVLDDSSWRPRMPGVLRALIEFSGAEQGLTRELIDETLICVTDHEPEYLRTIED